MKTPRIEAFVPPEKVHELASPLDGLPTIQPHRAAVAEPSAPEPQPVIEPTQQPAAPVEPPESSIAVESAVLDLDDYPTKTVTFPVTDHENLALGQMKLDITRTYQPPITATKERLLRLAIHYLVEDFRRNGEKSFAVRKLSKKSK